MEKREQAIPHYQQALSIRQGALGNEHHDVAMTHNSLGLVHYELGRYVQAREFYELSVAGFTNANHPDRSLVFHNIGLLEAALGNHSAALARYHKASALYEPVFPIDHERRRKLAADTAASKTALVSARRRPAKPSNKRSKEPTVRAGTYGSGPSWS